MSRVRLSKNSTQKLRCTCATVITLLCSQTPIVVKTTGVWTEKPFECPGCHRQLLLVASRLIAAERFGSNPPKNTAAVMRLPLATLGQREDAPRPPVFHEDFSRRIPTVAINGSFTLRSGEPEGNHNVLGQAIAMPVTYHAPSAIVAVAASAISPITGPSSPVVRPS